MSEDQHDSYLERLCDALADVLTRAAGGTKDRLAGYAANFDFWLAEAEHCLRLVDEYEERFKRFQEAQERVVATEGPIKWKEHSGWTPPPRKVTRATSWNERKAARGSVVSAMAKFLRRCEKEQLLGTEAIGAARRKIV